MLLLYCFHIRETNIVDLCWYLYAYRFEIDFFAITAISLVQQHLILTKLAELTLWEVSTLR